jgi:hypothetical protein
VRYLLLLALVVAGCGNSGTAYDARSSTPGASSSTSQPVSTPIPEAMVVPTSFPPDAPGEYGLEFHLKLVGNVSPGDQFDVFFHPGWPGATGEAHFTFCPGRDTPGLEGPCRSGATYIEGGGFQPAGSSIPYRFTRTSSGTTAVIAQGQAPMTTNEALVLVYPPSS